MNNQRIMPGDSRLTIITNMSDDSIGTMAVITELLFGKSQDRSLFEGGLHVVRFMDYMGLYGDKIYILFNDLCGGDLDKMCNVLLGVRFGWISREILVEACQRGDRSARMLIPVEEINHRLNHLYDDPNLSPQSILGMPLKSF